MKDQRYKAIKSLIETNNIHSIQDIFSIVPISVVKNDMKVNYNTLRRKIISCDLFTVKDIMQLGELFEVDPVEVFKILNVDNSKTKKAIKKKP